MLSSGRNDVRYQTEYLILRRLLFMLLGYEKLEENLSIRNISLGTFQSFIRDFRRVGENYKMLVSFEKRVASAQNVHSMSFTLRAYSEFVTQIVQLYVDAVCLLESDLTINRKAYTLLSLTQKLQPRLDEINFLAGIHRNAVVCDFELQPPWVVSSGLLAVLFGKISQVIVPVAHLKIVLELFLKSFAPYAKIIDNWLSTGRLEDFKREFIIATTTCTMEEEESFIILPFAEVLQELGIAVPKFLSRMALELFQYGKNVNCVNKLGGAASDDGPIILSNTPCFYTEFLNEITSQKGFAFLLDKQACFDANSPSMVEIAPISRILKVCLQSQLREKTCAILSFWKKMIFEEKGLIYHLDSLTKALFYLDLQPLMAKMCAKKIWRPWQMKDCLNHCLTCTLKGERIVCYFTLKENEEDGSGDFMLVDHQKIISLVDCVTFNYEVNWPMNVLITKETLHENYLPIFKISLKLKILMTGVNGLQFKDLSPTLEEVEAKILMKCRYDVILILRKFLYYFDACIRKSFNWSCLLKGETSLDALINVHKCQLKSMENCLFLSKDFNFAVKKMCVVCHTLQQTWNTKQNSDILSKLIRVYNQWLSDFQEYV